MPKKKLPIGISDFKKLIEEGFYYIDKTLLISELANTNGEVLLIPRPRRFGKTLNLSMLKYFVEKSSTSSAHLFSETAIWKFAKYRKLQGQYPVIFCKCSPPPLRGEVNIYHDDLACLQCMYAEYDELMKIVMPTCTRLREAQQKATLELWRKVILHVDSKYKPSVLYDTIWKWMRLEPLEDPSKKNNS